MPFEKLEYASITRGYSEKIIVDKDSVSSFQNNQKILSVKVTDKIIFTLKGVLKDIAISDLNQLSIPSEKFQSDQAMYSTLEIVRNEKTFKTRGFDNDNPPKELSPLLLCLEQLIK